MTRTTDVASHRETEYEIVVNSAERTVVGSAAITEAWGTNVPGLTAQILALSPGKTMLVFKEPQIEVRRLR